MSGETILEQLKQVIDELVEIRRQDTEKTKLKRELMLQAAEAGVPKVKIAEVVGSKRANLYRDLDRAEHERLQQQLKAQE